jgi:hypothetical protein
MGKGEGKRKGNVALSLGFVIGQVLSRDYKEKKALGLDRLPTLHIRHMCVCVSIIAKTFGSALVLCVFTYNCARI